MVKKLYKHEFSALMRMFFPLFGICVAIASVFSLSLVLSSKTNGSVAAGLISGISGFGFFLSLFGLAVVTFALLVIRFYNSFAKSEGYLTMSLPVEVNTHIVCKLVCGLVFELFSVIVAILSIFIVLAGAGWSGDIIDVFREFYDVLSYLISSGVISNNDVIISAVQLVIVFVLSGIQGLLMPYAAIAMGQRSNGKLGMSIVWYFVFNTALQIISGIASIIMGIATVVSETGMEDEMNFSMNFTVPMWFSIVLLAVSSLVFYIITRHNLKHKLNLE